MKKILITGGAGYIGSTVANLIQKKKEIYGCNIQALPWPIDEKDTGPLIFKASATSNAINNT